VDVELRPAGQHDRDLLLAWANDPDTRRASFSTAPIGVEEHATWLATVLSDPTRQLWIAEVDGEPVGQVRIDQRDRDAVISVSVAPEARGRGLAAPMIEAATARVDGRVVALVKPENERSLRAFETAGYRRARSDDAEVQLVHDPARG
jgi:RimJ/RimL family protein N-acetyltransferase